MSLSPEVWMVYCHLRDNAKHAVIHDEEGNPISRFVVFGIDKMVKERLSKTEALQSHQNRVNVIQALSSAHLLRVVSRFEAGRVRRELGIRCHTRLYEIELEIPEGLAPEGEEQEEFDSLEALIAPAKETISDQQAAAEAMAEIADYLGSDSRRASSAARKVAAVLRKESNLSLAKKELERSLLCLWGLDPLDDAVKGALKLVDELFE